MDNRPHILVVDDDSEIRTLLAQYLEKNEYRTTTVGDVTFDWEPHDIIVVPSWMKYTHKANGEAVIFSYSDRGPQELLGFWRDEK